MPDILTKTQKYCGFADNFERCMRPIAGDYWCPLHPFAPMVEFAENRSQTDLQASGAVSEGKNQSSVDSDAVTAAPETIHISLPALRSVILAVIDDGDPATTLNPSVLPALPWGTDHPFQDVANDARERLCDEIECRLRKLR